MRQGLMTRVTPIDHAGPIIEVIIKPTFGAFTGLTARGLIDTGATDILISPNIAAKLGLRLFSSETLIGVGGGSLEANVFGGLIEVPDLQFQRVVPFHAVPWQQTSHTVLLGRAFLKYFIFNYDGPAGMFHFSKPAGIGTVIVDDFDE